MRALLLLPFLLVSCGRVERRSSPPPEPPAPANQTRPTPQASPGHWISAADANDDYGRCAVIGTLPSNYSKEITLTRVRQIVKEYNCKGELIANDYRDVQTPNSDFWFKRIDLNLQGERQYLRFRVYNSSVSTCNGRTFYEGPSLEPNMTIDIAPTALNFHVEEKDNLLQYVLETCPSLDTNTWICDRPVLVERGTLVLKIHH